MVQVKQTKSIYGDINLSGAKNSALPIMVAACLCREPVTLTNMPTDLNDVKVMVNLLRELGAQVSVDERNKSISIFMPGDKCLNGQLSDEASKIRYSLLLMPLVLSFEESVSIPSPGGCNLGDRKYDIHLDTLTKMGAQMEDDGVRISGKRKSKLCGSELQFHIATTSGSEAALIAGCLADGKTIIKNANTRPEVIDLVNFLNAMGANITYKTRYIEITGVERLHGGSYRILSDRHQAISYAILAGICRSELRIKDFSVEFVQEDVKLLREIGMEIFEWGGDTYVSAKRKDLKPFSMATGAYPGINSDMQPLFAALALTIKAETIITHTRFTKRFQYVGEFLKFGADIVNYENCAVIQGGKQLNGADVVATDLRAGAALTFIAFYAGGITNITNYYQTKRGYEGIIEKLKNVGCQISEENE